MTRLVLLLASVLVAGAGHGAPVRAQAPAPTGPVDPGQAAAAPARPAPAPRIDAAAIEAAAFTGADLPSGRSALTAKVQVLLDRAGTSPGVIDGFKGGMSESAIRAFERRAGLPIDGVLDAAVWDALQGHAGEAMTMPYTITTADAEGLVDAIPEDFAEKATMTHLGYTSVAEKLAERFHMDERFIGVLNPDVPLEPGQSITVIHPAEPITGRVTRILVEKAARRVAVYAADGSMLADYPATIGSSETPSPSGDHTVARVAIDPNYTYNPKINFQQGDNDKVLTIPPGPNGPVGTVWIALSKPTYGIHGTPTPSQLFRNQSKGCVRLTNWDAHELAKMVVAGETTVEFLPEGVTIAQVTGAVPAAVAADAPAVPAAVADDAAVGALAPAIATSDATATGASASASASGMPPPVGDATGVVTATPTPDAPGSEDLLGEALADALALPAVGE